MKFSRKEYWSGLPCPHPEDLPNPGIELVSLMSPALAGGFFITRATWEAHSTYYLMIYFYQNVSCLKEWFLPVLIAGIFPMSCRLYGTSETFNEYFWNEWRMGIGSLPCFWLQRGIVQLLESNSLVKVTIKSPLSLLSPAGLWFLPLPSKSEQQGSSLPGASMMFILGLFSSIV